MLQRRKNRAPPLPAVCPLQECMRLLGGAWTPIIVWNLIGGPRRFSELRSDIPRVSAKVLTARLKALEASGVLTRTVQPTSPPSVDYALTSLGFELVPVIDAIEQAGRKLAGMVQHAPQDGRSERAAFLAQSA